MTGAVKAESSALGRLRLCRDILDVRAAIGFASESSKIKARVLGERRIAAIRRVLLNRSSDALADWLVGNSRAGVRAMESAQKNAEPEQRVKVAAYAAEITTLLANLYREEARAGLMPSGGLVLGVSQMPQHDEMRGLVRANIDAGKLDADVINEVGEQVKAAQAKAGAAPDLADVDPELNKQINSAQALSLEFLATHHKKHFEVQELFNQLRRGDFNEEPQRREWASGELERLREEATAAYKLYVKQHEKVYLPLLDKRRESIQAAIRATKQPLIELGEQVIADVASHSEITPEQATEWADAQEITKAAVARFKKIGYPVDQVRKDMADFYRVSGGRVPMVRVDSKGDRRANATDIDSHGKVGTINLDSKFTKRVLWHELAHHIEADPVARMAAGNFIRGRSEDGKAYSLRSLTGNSGYRSNETAYKDHFFSPYVGKIYRDGMTEVFSMVLESMSDPLRLAEVIAKDPETVEFVLGYLKQPIDPMAKTLMQLRGQLVGANEEAKEEQGNEIEQIVEGLAKQAPELVKDTDTSWAERWVAYLGKGKQIGHLQGWYVFSESIMNYSTGRRGTGFVVRRLEKSFSASGDERTSLANHSYQTKDIKMVRAAYAIFVKTGQWPSRYEIENESYLRKHSSQ